jgi:hypothetical protein
MNVLSIGHHANPKDLVEDLVSQHVVYVMMHRHLLQVLLS